MHDRREAGTDARALGERHTKCGCGRPAPSEWSWQGRGAYCTPGKALRVRSSSFLTSSSDIVMPTLLSYLHERAVVISDRCRERVTLRARERVRWNVSSGALLPRFCHHLGYSSRLRRERGRLGGRRRPGRRGRGSCLRAGLGLFQIIVCRTVTHLGRGGERKKRQAAHDR